jgi:D-sedoheptulose 7-phosphate isomerase
LLIQTLAAGRKVLIFGNGGSAADSQHIAGELVSKFRRERQALAAIALTTDTSILTSIGNDYGFDYLFARQIEALGQEGDVAWGISTSGNSPNVLRAVKTAREQGLITLGFTGQDGGELKNLVDICFCVPSSSTPRIQEVHITVAHALCELVEQAFCAVPA